MNRSAPPRRGRIAALVLTLAITPAALAACGSGTTGAGQPKAGGETPPTALRIGTPDSQGQPAGPVIDEFVRLVEADGDASLDVEPVFLAVPQNTDNWDQAVIRQVMEGDLDLALIPARAWDTEGVTSLRALNAPFLVDSDNLVDAIVSSDLADEMLAGLEPVGVTGLALLPESLRHVFSFASPLLAAADYDGALVRSPNSATTYALFEALGATPDDYPGQQVPDALAAGELTAMESAFALASFDDEHLSTAGNVVLFPKVNTLVVNTERFEALSDDQRQAIEAAAQGAREFARGAVVPDAEQAADYCESQAGSIVLASDADLAGLQAAVRPVYDELEQDAQTRQLIADIRDLKAETTPPVAVAECAAEPVAAGGAPTTEPSAIDGVYRYDVPRELFIEKGLVNNVDEAGVHTLTIDSGVWLDEWGGTERCEGVFTVDGDVWTIRWKGGCYGDWSMRLADTDPVTWADITTLPPWQNDPETIAANELFNSVPLTRVADVS